MRGSRLATLLGAFGLALCFAGDAAAQPQAPFLLVPVQDLEFGRLTPGVPQLVAPTDVARRAELRVTGRGVSTLTFLLPAFLESVEGARIPLTFSATDGLLVIRNRSTAFDPAGVLDVRLQPADQEARIYLGGRAVPAVGQPAGAYTATITVMIVQTGT